MGLANTVIFQYGLSSAFIPLICSNVKLIYIDCGWEKLESKPSDTSQKKMQFLLKLILIKEIE